MLHTRPINEITYQDVIDFCNAGHEEGPILEYKRDFSSLPNDKIAKTIAAFANTYGGILIIGVNAPMGKPIAPFEGFAVDPVTKYEEKIESVILSNINEPVFPEIRVCDPVKGKTFIVVRVTESQLTPHRVFDDRKIYIRTGQSSKPEEEASWEKIEWLALRRKKSEEFREFLLEQSEEYFINACKLRNINLDDLNSYFATVSISSIPVFPNNPLIPYKDLDGIEVEIKTGRGRGFPPSLYHADLIQNGIRKLDLLGHDGTSPEHGKVFEYTFLDAFGLYGYKHDIGAWDLEKYKKLDQTVGERRIKYINYYEIPLILHRFLSSATLFYQRLGYWGSIRVTFKLLNALGVKMHHPLKGQIHGASDVLVVPSNNLVWQKTISIPQLRGSLQDIEVELIHNTAWSLGIRYYTEERIRKHLEGVE